MKRFSLKQNKTVTCSPMEFDAKIQSIAHMEESRDGEWVKATDHFAAVAALEVRIPDIRIERLEKALGLVESGKCPECECYVRGYMSPTGAFAPEAYESMRERGINPSTGHRVTCSRQSK